MSYPSQCKDQAPQLLLDIQHPASVLMLFTMQRYGLHWIFFCITFEGAMLQLKTATINFQLPSVQSASIMKRSISNT